MTILQLEKIINHFNIDPIVSTFFFPISDTLGGRVAERDTAKKPSEEFLAQEHSI